MMNILYRPMVKEALVLVTSGVLATMICSRVYAAPVGEAETAAPAVAVAAAPAPAETRRLQAMAPDQARAFFLAAIRGQTPLAGGALR
ncbi:MAG: hypothetical protein JSR47_15855 [Proteobacteria bacterium]|nr:hypothetical protein [Pseudomonadota bacterium]MBS0546384.1 hypothetical protein [Pseudomonadota bacterium]